MSGGDLINAAINTEELEVSAAITTEEPEIAATLSDLRYLVFQGMKGDTGNCNFAMFEIDPTTGILSATYTTDDSGISFEINSAKHLEVVIQ